MAEWTRDTPWRQGHLLTDEAVTTLGLALPKQHPSGTIVIVATHDCDLAQPPENESVIEVIVGCRIVSLDGNYTHAKNARILHNQFEGNTPLLAEFTATEKRSIQKKALIGFEPQVDQCLSPTGKATFQRWLAARYRRSAFPDEFERRLVRETKLAKKIASAVKTHGELIVAVLFDVDEGQDCLRKTPDDVYVLDIILLHSVEIDFNQAEAAALASKEAIQAAFKDKLFDQQSGKWQSIELRYCDVLSEEAMTYRQFSLMKPWRLEYISLGADPQQKILVE